MSAPGSEREVGPRVAAPARKGRLAAAALLEAVIDTALGQVVGGHLDLNLVACENRMRFLRIFPAVCAMISWPFSSFDPECRVGQEFLHDAGKFEHFFLGHGHSLFGAPPRGAGGGLNAPLGGRFSRQICAGGAFGPMGVVSAPAPRRGRGRWRARSISAITQPGSLSDPWARMPSSGKPVSGGPKMPAAPTFLVHGGGPWRIAHGGGLHHDALVFQRAGHGADAHAVVAMRAVGAGGDEQDLGALIGQASGKKGKLGVVANQDADAAQRRFDHLERVAGGDIPGLALEAGHDLLVLVGDEGRLRVRAREARRG